jgi:predicted NUDIX family NTP pyrophosphohydrolase
VDVTSAGVLIYRRRGAETEFLLGRAGGPLRAKKHLGAWMVPEGLIEAGEDPLAAALREDEALTRISPSQAPLVWEGLHAPSERE